MTKPTSRLLIPMPKARVATITCRESTRGEAKEKETKKKEMKQTQKEETRPPRKKERHVKKKGRDEEKKKGRIDIHVAVSRACIE